MPRPDRARRFVSCLACALLLGAAPRSAHAQQPRGRERVYVGGSLLADIKRFSGDTTDPTLDGESMGGGVTIGTALASRWDLQLGVDVPRFSGTSHDRLVTLQKFAFTLQSVTRNQTLSVATLIRFHGGRHGRVQLGYLGGLSVVRLRRDVHTEAPDGTPAGLIPRPDFSVGYTAAPTLGIDAQIVIADHLSLVPGLQATVFSLPDTSGILLRPRLGLRWTF